MYRKALIVGLLIAISLQFVTSLTCYTCVNQNDCKKPKKTTCSQAAADETSHYLSVYHDTVRDYKGNRFDCLALKYTFFYNNSVPHQLHGCIYRDMDACSLHLKPQYYSWRKTKCIVCSGNKCNKSPAGKLSSSVYTIVATALALALIKLYA